MNATGILLCGHGSRDAEGVADFLLLVQAVRQRFPQAVLTHGFLEFASPTICEALDALGQSGVRQVAAVPIMLTAAGHVKEDIPKLIRSYATKHPDMDVTLGAELGFDDNILQAAAERIQEVAANPAESMLLVVGRGASDPQVIHDVQRVTEALRNRLGFRAALACYCGLAEPSLEAALSSMGARSASEEETRRVSAGRCSLALRAPIVVFPFLLFRGRILQQIHQTVDAAANIRIASCLHNHPLVIETVCQRILAVFPCN